MPASPLRVAVVSRHPLTRAGLTGLLAQDPSRALLHDVAAQDGHLGGHDVAIYDLAGLVASGTDDLQHLLSSGAPVVALEAPSRPDLGEGALTFGVAEVFTMAISGAELLDVLERAAQGGTVSVLEYRHGMHEDLRQRVGLSIREIEVLDLIASGYSNEQISAQLYLTMNSIKTYIRQAYKKIGVDTRPRAVLWALDHGLGRRS